MEIIPKILIWLGAGKVETPKINFEKFDVVLLVEARETQVSELQKRFTKDDNIEIIQATVSNKKSKVDFFQYSLEECSASSVASGLKELYPGLRLTEQYQVTAKDVVDVLHGSINDDADITLVLDIIDINHLILSRLIESEVWKNIHQVYLPIPELSLYEGAASNSELLPLLKVQGFDALDIDYSDPDVPIAKLKRNPMWAELQLLRQEHNFQKVKYQNLINEYEIKLQTQNEEAENAKIELTKLLEKARLTTKKENEKAESKYAELIAEKQQDDLTLKNVTKQLKQSIEEVNELNLRLIYEKESASEDAEHIKTNLNQKVSELETEKANFSQKLDMLTSEKQQLINESKEITKSTDHQLQQLKSEIEELTEKLNKSKADNDQKITLLETEKANFSQKLDVLTSEKQQLIIEREEITKSTEHQLQQLKSEIEELTEKLNKSKADNDQKITSLETEKANFSQKLDVLTSEKQQLMSEREEITKSTDHQLQQLNNEIEELTEKLNKSEDDSKQKIASLESEKTEFSQKIDLLTSEKQQLTSELEKITNISEKQQQNLLNEIKELSGCLNKAKADKVSLVSSFDLEKSAIEEKSQELKQTLENEKHELEAKINSQKVELTQLSAKLDDLMGMDVKNQKRAEDLVKKIQTLEAALKDANDSQKSAFQTLTLNTKLMTKLEIDNNALRESLVTKNAEQKELKGLIRELHEKLQLASEFYNQIQKEYPELITSGS